MAIASLGHAAVFPAHEHSNGFYRLNDPDDASKVKREMACGASGLGAFTSSE